MKTLKLVGRSQERFSRAVMQDRQDHKEECWQYYLPQTCAALLPACWPPPAVAVALCVVPAAAVPLRTLGSVVVQSCLMRESHHYLKMIALSPAMCRYSEWKSGKGREIQKFGQGLPLRENNDRCYHSYIYPLIQRPTSSFISLERLK